MFRITADQRIENLQKQIDELKQRLSLRERDIVDLSGIINTQNSIIQDLKNTITQQQKILDSQNITIKTNTQKIREFETNISNVNSYMQQLQQQLQQRDNEIIQLRNRDLSYLRDIQQQQSITANRIEIATAQITQQQKQYEDSVNNLNKILSEHNMQYLAAMERVAQMNNDTRTYVDSAISEINKKVSFAEQQRIMTESNAARSEHYCNQTRDIYQQTLSVKDSIADDIQNISEEFRGKLNSDYINYLNGMEKKERDIHVTLGNFYEQAAAVNAQYNKLMSWFQSQNWDWNELMQKIDFQLNRISYESEMTDRNLRLIREDSAELQRLMNDLTAQFNRIKSEYNAFIEQLQKQTDIGKSDIADVALNYRRQIQADYGAIVTDLRNISFDSTTKVNELREQLTLTQRELSDIIARMNELYTGVDRWTAEFIDISWNKLKQKIESQWSDFKHIIEQACREFMNKWFEPLRDSIGSITDTIITIIVWLKQGTELGKRQFEILSEYLDGVRNFCLIAVRMFYEFNKWAEQPIPPTWEEFTSRANFLWTSIMQLLAGLPKSVHLTIAQIQLMQAYVQFYDNGKDIFQNLWQPVQYDTTVYAPENLLFLQTIRNRFTDWLNIKERYRFYAIPQIDQPPFGRQIGD